MFIIMKGVPLFIHHGFLVSDKPLEFISSVDEGREVLCHGRLFPSEVTRNIFPLGINIVFGVKEVSFLNNK